MAAIVHQTEGLLDIRAITVFGMSAKPNSSNPIGFFGTGLKNAIAVLVRGGYEVFLHVGETTYIFYTQKTNFRGTDFSGIRMRKREGLLSKWQVIDLPFTTELGRNWEVWQAFRELEANTRDEGGTTYLVSENRHESCQPKKGFTRFVITNKGNRNGYLDAWAECDTIFLPKAKTLREGTESIEVFSGQSQYLYYRGLRVYKLDKPSRYTYNILSQSELTEDRTLKYIHYAQSLLESEVAQSKDLRFIKDVLLVDGHYWEDGLNFRYQLGEPSAEFKSVVTESRRSSVLANRGIYEYTDKYTNPPPKKKTLWERADKWIDSPVYASFPESFRKLFKEMRDELHRVDSPF